MRNDSGAYGVSYRWNESQSDAELAENDGETFPVDITLDDSPTTIEWQIPSRSACMTCHTPEAGHALSFNTLQLNREGEVHGVSGNFLAKLESAGYLENFTANPAHLSRHVRPDELAYSLEARVRSYLDVNCAYCHQADGTAGGSWDGRSLLKLAETGLVNGEPVDAPVQTGDRLVIPGQSDHSILYNRMAAANGYSRMPPLATTEIDYEGVQILTEWINSEISPYTSYEEWRTVHFGDNTSAEGERDIDADHDSQTNEFEYLTHSDPTDPSDLWSPEFKVNGETVSYQFNGLTDRRIQVFRSNDLETWTLWQAPGNEGIPFNDSLQTLESAAVDEKEFFRFEIEAR
jgi:mono/diheme cytochrome c family protein